MNLLEELQALDVNDVGRWPFVFRAGVIGLVFVAVLGLGVYWFIVKTGRRSSATRKRKSSSSG